MCFMAFLLQKESFLVYEDGEICFPFFVPRKTVKTKPKFGNWKSAVLPDNWESSGSPLKACIFCCKVISTMIFICNWYFYVQADGQNETLFWPWTNLHFLHSACGSFFCEISQLACKTGIGRNEKAWLFSATDKGVIILHSRHFFKQVFLL